MTDWRECDSRGDRKEGGEHRTDPEVHGEHPRMLQEETDEIRLTLMNYLQGFQDGGMLLL